MESNSDVDLDPNKDDLPLRANTNHILVRHYVLDLTVHFERKVIGGSIVLFLEPAIGSCKQGEPGSVSKTEVQNGSQVSSKHDLSSPITPEPNELIPSEEPSCLSGGNDVSDVFWGDESEEFNLVLDCCDLMVSKVEEVDVTTVSNLKELLVDHRYANADHLSSSLVQRLVSMPSVCWRSQHELYLQCSRSPTVLNAQPLRFHMDQWSLQVRKEGVCSSHDFPSAVRIWYETKPTGGSVRWTKDQDSRCCVYTMGSPINNRALFPCQEPPVAMSTWQACVRAPCDYIVLMSGENQAIPKPAETGFLQWDYYVTMPMPASTFTIAVGKWLEAGVNVPNFEVEKTDETCVKVLSPHIMFLSQSVLTGERNLCGARLCHEIAHSWFGLAIGARDWTEEWISEGFATYLEDALWNHVQKLGYREAEEQRRLKALLRWRRLSDELQNSEVELQVLRPNKENTGEVSESGASLVKHALNPEKPFMQVHYLKGYFLLKFLADQVGEEKFLHFFKVFVGKFHGQLILSQDFLQMLLDTFPAMSSRGIRLETIFSDWLDTPETPEWLRDSCSEWSQTPVVQEVREEVAKWIHFSGSGGKGSKRKRSGPKVNFKELSPEQLVLLLEFLLEEPKLSLSTLRLLQTTYNLQAQDAEVKHRWCELAVKHKHTAAYRDVELFLIHDQAMGVYLYGELMVQEDARQQALARRCLSFIKDDMDQSARSVVEEMIL
ncbi:aminopeptidase O isoform X3 [Pimephales promelas]|uniref:aminopeptidase O isoform X3 n=1 Tax=Pimephales promelas TaxID=90988 RepID=UPI001955C0F1|nr:aminopeptidase O isoform X3 [Pimephales promelas]